MYPKLNLPDYSLKIKKTDKGNLVFDNIRKKFILLTPEEYVRQQFVNYLIDKKNYPKGLIGIEKQIKIFGLNKRTDIVLFNKQGNAGVIVECKAPEVSISQNTFDQIARYNMKFKAEYLIVTNGLSHYCCKPNYADNTYDFIKDIPKYEDLIQNR
jgi:hypothetical protein